MRNKKEVYKNYKSVIKNVLKEAKKQASKIPFLESESKLTYKQFVEKYYSNE